MPGPYTFDQMFAVDPNNSENVAKGGTILLYAPGDPTKTPITITDVSGGITLPNPVPINASGFGSAFQHPTLDQIAWEGGGFVGTFESYRGMKASSESSATSAAAAQAAAEGAAASAAGEVAETLAVVVADSEAAKIAAQQAAALVGAPTDVSTAALVGNRATLTGGAVYAAVAQGAIIADVSPLKTPLANRLAFVSAFTQGQAQGRDVEIPSTMGADKIPIDGEILINGTGNIRIYTPHSCSIYQTVKPETIFNIKAPSVIIEPGFVGIGDGLDMTGMVTAINYARYSGVWFNAGSSGSQVRGFKGVGLHRAVRVDPDVTTVALPADVPNIRNLKALEIESVDCWVAVSAVGFNDLEVSVRGTYKKAFNSGGVDTTGQPPHLIYVIDRGSGATARLNYNLHIGPSLAWDSGVPVSTEGPAAAYAVKGVVGFSYDGLQARNCAGLLDLINVTAISPGTAVAVDDVYPIDGARGSVAIKDSVGAKIRATVVAKKGDYGRLLYVEGGCTDSEIDVELTVNKTTAVTAVNEGVARVSGKRNIVRAKINNLGAPIRAAISCSSSGAFGNQIINPVVSGPFRYPVEVTQGARTLVQYDPRNLPFDAIAGATPASVSVSGTATKTTLRNTALNDPALDPNYVDTFTRDDAASLGQYSEDGAEYISVNAGTFNITAGSASATFVASGGSQRLIQTASIDGVVRLAISEVGDGGGGYILRSNLPVDPAVTLQDYLRFRIAGVLNSGRPAITSRIAGGTQTTLATAAAGAPLLDGDIVEIVMAGTSISVYKIVGDFATGVRAASPFLTATDPDASTNRVYRGLDMVSTNAGDPIRWDAHKYTKP